jgi:hypothetical protein
MAVSIRLWNVSPCVVIRGIIRDLDPARSGVPLTQRRQRHQENDKDFHYGSYSTSRLMGDLRLTTVPKLCPDPALYAVYTI